jgi:O-antigen ligase
VIVLAQNIRYDVVLSRIIKIAIPFAVWNMIAGIRFFAIGAPIGPPELSYAPWQGDSVLLLAYVLAFARTIGGGKAAKLPLIILALGVLAPLHKPTMATFLGANIIMLYLAARSRLKVGTVRTGKIILVLSLLLIAGIGFGKYLFGLSEGAAGKYLRRRILKRAGATTRDITGARLEMWEECADLWKTNPIMGKGLGHKLHGTHRGIPFPLPIHNIVVQTLMQTGLIGLIIVAIAAITWFWRSIKTLAWETVPTRVWPRLGLVTYIFTILLATLYGESLAVRCISFTFWIAVAMETAAHSQLIHWSLQEQLEYAPTQIMEDTFFEQEAF